MDFSRNHYSVLIIEKNTEDGKRFGDFLRNNTLEYAFSCIYASNLAQGSSYLQEKSIDLILVGYELFDGSALDLLKQQNKNYIDYRIPVVVISDQGDEKTAVRVMKSGAYDYLVKQDLNQEYLVRAVIYALEKKGSEIRQRSQQYFTTILMDTIPHPIYILDKEQNILGCNQTFLDLFGGQRERNTRLACTPAIFPYEIEALKHGDRLFLQGEGLSHQELELIYPSTNGEGMKSKQVIVYRNLYEDPKGNLEGMVGMILDVSQSKDMEEELRTANEAKDRFFALIAHDLRGPVGSMSGILESLTDEEMEFDQEERKRLLDHLYITAKSTLELLENLLQWSRSQRGMIKFEPNEYPLLPIVEENIALLDASAKQKAISFDLFVDSGLLVYGDLNMIRTILRNLISNAIKFSHREGSIEIHAQYKKNGMALIFVKDYGMGIPCDLHERIFQPGEKVIKKGTNKEKGTGIGLILSREFVERNSGDIWFDSSEGEGSTFYFTLPSVE